MSKAINKKWEKIIDLLNQATLQLSELDRKGKKQDCLSLLCECQEAAITLGNHIEKIYGGETKTVSALEKFCEELYVASIAIEQGNSVDFERLTCQIHMIMELFREEFPERLEVVLLPYKASMWDSLESIWKAAKEDENCDAYVIPIPYYDLDAKQNPKAMHYEGDLYPDYVPVTHYEKYDLELHHPDVIYIHNPYDEYNAVTSIAPEFYSSKIKDYTDKLVYIPYFVLGEIDPENQKAIDKMKHFCFLPGTIYADRVIVQSENMRKIYINEFYKAAQEYKMHVTKEELAGKFLGLGSPKYDKLLNTEKEKLIIPTDWRRIIEKPDGSWKKIIFYNTSLSAFLREREKMLVKIQDVLRIFKKQKEDVVLLWRPHPLMKETIDSMSPELSERYQEIVRQYQEEDWGIYDDTPDMDRAIILSDGYYGDPSSVVQLYQKTQKPIMLQNVDVI